MDAWRREKRLGVGGCKGCCMTPPAAAVKLRTSAMEVVAGMCTWSSGSSHTCMQGHAQDGVWAGIDDAVI